MSTLVAEIEGIKLYTDERLTTKFLDVTAKWDRIVVDHVKKGSVLCTWPDRYTLWSRFKSLLGIYKRIGVIGFFSPKSRRIYIIISHMTTLGIRISPVTINILAHEYQHAALFTNSEPCVRIVKPFVQQWYLYFLKEECQNPTVRRYVETKLVPTLIKSDLYLGRSIMPEVRQRWLELYQLSKSSKLKTIVKFIVKQQSLSSLEYFRNVYQPAKEAYTQLLGASPFLNMIAFYQELYIASEIQSVRATVKPFAKDVKQLARLARI